MRSFVFRVDGGNIYSVATGHITRCLKLADFISSQEHATIIFIMKNCPEGIGLAEKKYRVIPLDSEISSNAESVIVKKTIPQGSYFICDVRGITQKYVLEVKSVCKKVILFDDLSVQDRMTDIVINPTPFCYENYGIDRNDNTVYLLGENFFFLNQRLAQDSSPRDFDKKELRIMASFGGADPCKITEFFVNSIVPRLSSDSVSVIIGPANARKEAILRKYKGSAKCSFITDVCPLDELLLSHDIAFVCGGDTCIESCASGVATIVISSIHYEKKIAGLLYKKGLIYFFTDIENIKDNTFDMSNLDSFLADRQLLRSLSEKGRTFVDGGGTSRVYREIIK